MRDLTSLCGLNEKYSIFNCIADDADAEGSKFRFSASDGLTSKDMVTRCGSMILDGYHPVFDATSIERMRAHGGKLIGKTNLDEFGSGSFCTNSGFGIPKNPFDLERSCGGASGGSACAAAVIDDHVSLGVSTGGSVCCPASFCGVYGLTPTYGRVSRYGVIDCGNSFDKVGILSADPRKLTEFLPVISGKDARDPTSCGQPPLEVRGKKIKSVAVPKDLLSYASKDVLAGFESSLDILKSMGIDVKMIDMPSLKYAVPAYIAIETAELSTNLASYVGMRYGQQEGDLSMKFDDYFTWFRTKYFQDETKRRIIIGTNVRMAGLRERYYLKSVKVRQQLISVYKKVFADHDAVVTPTMPYVSPRFDEIKKMTPLETYGAERFTAPPNLTGMPQLSVPCGYDKDGMPVGMQIVTDHWMEDPLLTFANDWGSAFDVRKPEVLPC